PLPPLNIEPVRAFQDNYIWLLSRPGSDQVCVVDPGDAAPVLTVLRERGLQLAAILLTHHHADHTGGVRELADKAGIPVYGPANSKFEHISEPLRETARIQVLDCEFQVLE